MAPAAGNGDDEGDPFDDVAAGLGDDQRDADEVWREFEVTDTDPGAVWDRLDDGRADVRPWSSADRDARGPTNGHGDDDPAFHFPADAAGTPSGDDREDAASEAIPSPDAAEEPAPDSDLGRTVGVSNLTKILHGYVTAMLVGSALTIYVGTALGALPRHLWILSLPLLALGAFLVLPVLAWQLGYWHPARLS